MLRMMMTEYFITICKKAHHPAHHDRPTARFGGFVQSEADEGN